MSDSPHPFSAVPRFTTTAPFMAFPQGRLVRIGGTPPEAEILDDQGKWVRSPTLDRLAVDDTTEWLTLDEAERLAGLAAGLDHEGLMADVPSAQTTLDVGDDGESAATPETEQDGAE